MTFGVLSTRKAMIVATVLSAAACGGRTSLLLEGDVETSNDNDGGIVGPSDSGVSSMDAADVVEAVDAPFTDIAQVTTPPPDFVWYRLDETVGAIAHDSSPHHYDIGNLDGVVWDDGAVFDGQTVCGSTEVGAAFRTAPVTMTVWLTAYDRSDETSSEHALTPFPPNAFSGDAPSLGGFGVGANVWTDGTPGNGMTFETGENAAVAFYTIGGIDAGAQYFAALVVAPTSADFYVNATLWASVQADTPYADTPAPLHLGCHNDDTDYLTKRFFKGRLRDARIYTRLLGADEIAQIYGNGPV